MNEVLIQIKDALRDVQTNGGNDAFVTFIINYPQAYGGMVQFAGSQHVTGLYGEATGVDISKTQEIYLRQLGWQPGDPNWFRKWTATNETERLPIAHFALLTLQLVYDFSQKDTLHVRLHL